MFLDAWKFSNLLSPAQDSDTHVRSSNFSVIPARARVWRVRGIPNSAGARGEGPGFFARQPRARMTEQEIEQDPSCHYDLQSSIGRQTLLLSRLSDPPAAGLPKWCRPHP